MSDDMQTETVTTIHHKVTIDRQELLKLIASLGYDIPTNAVISVCVPGGGDWSNTSLDIDKDNPIQIEWVTVDSK